MVPAGNYMCESRRDDHVGDVVAALARCWAQFDAKKNALAFHVLVSGSRMPYRRLLVLLRALHAHGAIIQRRYSIVEQRTVTLDNGSTEEYTTDWEASPLALLLDGGLMLRSGEADMILEIEAFLVSIGCDRCAIAKTLVLAYGLDSRKRARDNDDE